MITKPKSTPLLCSVIAEHLSSESERYKQLAKDAALHVLSCGDPHGARKVREHLIRAETYKDAARIARAAVDEKK